MNRLLVASRTRPVIDLPIFLGKYEFTVVPPSLFVPDDLFYQETEKADLSLGKHATSTRQLQCWNSGFLETNFRKVIIMMEWLSLTKSISRPSS